MAPFVTFDVPASDFEPPFVTTEADFKVDRLPEPLLRSIALVSIGPPEMATQAGALPVGVPLATHFPGLPLRLLLHIVLPVKLLGPETREARFFIFGVVGRDEV